MLKHPLWLRLIHWFNVPMLMIMIWSGILIYWANPAYGKIPSFLIDTFRLNFRLAEGMGWHFFIMWFFTINGFLYLLFFLSSGHWRKILPQKQTFRSAIPYLLYDLKIRKESPVFAGEYNPLQRLAYTAAILMGILVVLSGWAIFKPVQMGWLGFFFGGYKGSRLVHFICLIGFMGFIFIHIIQVIRAGFKNFRGMVTGV